MSDLIELKLVTEEEAECLHRLQVEAFMPLYEKQNGVKELDEEQHYRLEKFKEVSI